MSWNAKLSHLAKSSATASINALDAAACFGDPSADPDFAAHLAGAQSAAIAAAAAMTGAASAVDVEIMCSPDATGSPSHPYDVGAKLMIFVTERY